MSTQTTTGAKTTAAERDHAAAIKHTEATAAEIEAARDQVAAAEQALEDAKAELEAAVMAKSADPTAAKERIQNARDGIKEAQENLEFAILQHQASEVVNRQAYEDEQAARRRVKADEYLRECARWNDPMNRERQLLAQLTDIIAELTPLIGERKDLHGHLLAEWAHIPIDERPDIPVGHGLAPDNDYLRLTTGQIAEVPTEVVDAIKAGAAKGVRNEYARTKKSS